jgi:uncharacterized protein YqhQ
MENFAEYFPIILAIYLVYSLLKIGIVHLIPSRNSRDEDDKTERIKSISKNFHRIIIITLMSLPVAAILNLFGSKFKIIFFFVFSVIFILSLRRNNYRNY